MGTPLLEGPERRTSAVFDREGGLWVGTFGQGAFRLEGVHLQSLTEDPARRVLILGDQAWVVGSGAITQVGLAGAPSVQTLHRSGLRSIARAPGGGLRFSGQATLWPILRPERFHQTRFPLQPAVADPSWVSGSAETSDTLWASTYGNGVRRFRKGTGGLAEIDTISVRGGLPTDAVEGIVRTSAGTWAITRRGLARLRDGRAHAMGRAEGLPSSAVFSFYESRDGTHWAGTDRGLARLADGPHRAGEHTAQLGVSHLAPGVYVVRLSAGEDMLTRRLTVVR